MNFGYYDRLRPAQIEEIFRERPIAYLPWGAIEYHGSHNPTGLDTHKAYHLCNELAKTCGGLIFPPINLAANLIKSYPGVNFKRYSIEFSEQLIQKICEEYFIQLSEQHFKIVVLLSGHAGEPHLQILRDVAKRFNDTYTNTYFWAFAEFDMVPDQLLVANHSALGETSLQLLFEPDTVDLSTLPKNGEINLSTHAVSGKDPRNSDPVLGEKIKNAFLKNSSNELLQLIKKFIKNEQA